MRTLVMVATYNEKENIEPLITEIFERAPAVNILVIDDNSPDKTYEIVERLARDKYAGQLFLLKRAGKLGLGTAYVAGFNWGIDNNYDVLLQMDADFSHNPRYIPTFLKEIEKYDLVLGSRYVRGGGVVNWGLVRRFISKGGSLYARTILGIKTRDLTGGFKCWRRTTLEAIDINSLVSNGYSFQIETTYKTFLRGLSIKEVPIIFEDRRVGYSKMSSKIFVEALFMVIKLKFKTK